MGNLAGTSADGQSEDSAINQDEDSTVSDSPDDSPDDDSGNESNQLKERDHVVVKYDLPKGSKYFVGVITEVGFEDNQVTYDLVFFHRKKRSYFVLTPTDTDSLIGSDNIVFKLKQPFLNNRLQYIFDLSDVDVSVE